MRWGDRTRFPRPCVERSGCESVVLGPVRHRVDPPTPARPIMRHWRLCRWARPAEGLWTLLLSYPRTRASRRSSPGAACILRCRRGEGRPWRGGGCGRCERCVGSANAPSQAAVAEPAAAALPRRAPPVASPPRAAEAPPRETRGELRSGAATRGVWGAAQRRGAAPRVALPYRGLRTLLGPEHARD